MKKTIKKRAFISAIAMLIVSAIVLTSSTFAWFSMAKRVEVEKMQLNITSPEGIQISANTNAFTTSLVMGDFTGESGRRFMADSDNTNHFPEVLSPSSSAFRFSANALPRFFAGSIDAAGKANANAVTDATGGYVVFDLYVKLGVAANVYFGESTITCGDNADVPTAMRIAMVNCGASTDKAAAKTVQKTSANGSGRTAVVFEPDATHHTEASGVTTSGAVAWQGVTAAYEGKTPQGANKNTYTNEGTNTEKLTCTLTNDTSKTDAYFAGAAGINRIRVYVWMEGNDVDCANDVAGSTIEVNLVFTID